MIKLVLMSDTHGLHNKVEVPDGDILIHAGDWMSFGTVWAEVYAFADWWNQLPHKHKILVHGNHDRLAETSPGLVSTFFPNTHILRDSGIELENLKFWGSPYTPNFMNWAFMENRGADIKRHWDLIPDGLDVLITHGPPNGFLDACDGLHFGCQELCEAVYRAKPQIHVFGHIHAGHGVAAFPSVTDVGTMCHNVAICDEWYDPVNVPHEVSIVPRSK